MVLQPHSLSLVCVCVCVFLKKRKKLWDYKFEFFKCGTMQFVLLVNVCYFLEASEH